MPTIGRRGQGRLGRVSENLQAIIDTMLKSKIQEESQRRQNDYISQRQSQLSEQGHRERVEELNLASQLRGDEATHKTTQEILASSLAPKATKLEELGSAAGTTAQLREIGQTDDAFGGKYPIIMGREQVAMPDREGPPSTVEAAMRARQALESRLLEEGRVDEQATPHIEGGLEGFTTRAGQFTPTERTAGDEASRQAGIRGAEEGATIDTRYGKRSQLGAIAQEQATGVGRGLSATAQDRMTGTGASLNMIQQIRQGLPEFGDEIGPFGQWLLKAELYAPGVDVREEFAKWDARITTLKNNVIKAQTGAQMSEPEARRIMGQVPDLSNKAKVFKARLDVTEENMKFMEQRILQLANQGNALAQAYIKENGLQYLDGAGQTQSQTPSPMDFQQFLQMFGN